MGTVLLIALMVVLLALSSRGRTTNKRIEQLAPRTMLVHHADGSKREHAYDGETDEYYQEETAADYLCTPEKYSQVEIKNVHGQIYRYDRAAMVRLKWF